MAAAGSKPGGSAIAGLRVHHHAARLAAFTIAVACGAACGVACGRPEPAEPPPAQVRFTSGAPGAGFIRLAQALEGEYERALPGLDIRVLESEGATSNVEAIQRGDADIGLGHVNITYFAYLGRLAGSGVPFTRLRGIATLHLMSVHLLARNGSGISRVEQLRGRRVGLGLGRGTAVTATLVLGAFGIGLGEVQVVPVRYAEVPDLFARDKLDAHLISGSYPLEAVTEATGGGARLLPLDGPAIDRLHDDYPFFRRVLVPAGTYPGQQFAVHSVGVDSLLLCRADLDESLVYDLTRTLFDVLPSLTRLRLPAIDVDLAPATLIPLHPGAARYYRERELSR